MSIKIQTVCQEDRSLLEERRGRSLPHGTKINIKTIKIRNIGSLKHIYRENGRARCVLRNAGLTFNLLCWLWFGWLVFTVKCFQRHNNLYTTRQHWTKKLLQIRFVDNLGRLRSPCVETAAQHKYRADDPIPSHWPVFTAMLTADKR